MKRRLALEPVAFSLIKETFQPYSLVADELLNVYWKTKVIKYTLGKVERLRKYAERMEMFNQVTRIARVNRAQKIMLKWGLREVLRTRKFWQYYGIFRSGLYSGLSLFFLFYFPAFKIPVLEKQGNVMTILQVVVYDKGRKN